jgi:beta-alanine--pyruvate transaminase
VNFGGISVGGMVGNRKVFGQGIEADHLPHAAAHGQLHQGHARRRGRAAGRPPAGLIALHDASNIAAVIVEPFSARPAW